MKVILSLALLLFSCQYLSAQSMIVPLTERGYISCEKDDYEVGDTLIVRGAILSTDYNDFYPYSRYVNIELIDITDSVFTRQKVTLSENGYFYATIPTSGVRYQGRYFLRAYTQFMRNQSPLTFPMNTVNLYVGQKPNLNYTSSITPSSSQKACPLTIRDLKTRLQISVADTTTPLDLYCFQTGFGLIKLTLQPGKAISFDTSQIPDGMLTFWLRNGNNTIAEKSVWVGDVHNQKIPLSEFDNSSVKPVVIKRVVDDNSLTFHAFESLNLLQHVHSDQPFPNAFYHVPADSAKTLLNSWLATCHFIGFDLQKAIEGSFDYPYVPEKNLSLTGTALTKSKKLIDKGTVEILNVSSLDNHICPIDSTGHYNQAVADFPVGSRFFLEAKNKKGKPHNYTVTWNDEKPPLVNNWLHHYAMSGKSDYSSDFLKPVDYDPNGIMLDEVQVKGKRIDYNFQRKSQMKGMYLYDLDDLQRNKYRDVESLLRQCGMIKFVDIETDRVAIWRGGKDYRLNPLSKPWMKVLCDNVLYTYGYSSLFCLPASDFESIEIVRPQAADPRLTWNDAPYGLIIMKSNMNVDLDDVTSNGITVTPTGIDFPLATDYHFDPIPGKGQHLAVDAILPNQQIVSWEEW